MRRSSTRLRRINRFGEGLERQIYTAVREGSQHHPSVRLVRQLITDRFAGHATSQ
jgi:hypothetical protein